MATEYTIYDVTVMLPTRDAPGLQSVTDIVFDALAAALDQDENTLSVVVKGPPEFHIGLVPR